MSKRTACDEIRFGSFLRVSFQRTLRVPDDGRTYPLPPGFGAFPVRRVRDYAGVPVAWREGDGFFIPMYQREALWLAFEGPSWHPTAVQVGVGAVNAVSGGPWHEGLLSVPQNYLVCPDQPWLDGINVGDGLIRQFVAMPLGLGYTVEEQLAGVATGGIRLRALEARAGRFPTRPPRKRSALREVTRLGTPRAMGLGAGGRMHQRIYADPYGIDTWNEETARTVFVHILNSEQFHEVTGEAIPSTPITAKTYTDCGLPWFELYDEEYRAIPGSEKLASVQSVRALDQEAGRASAEDSVHVRPDQVRGIRRTP